MSELTTLVGGPSGMDTTIFTGARVRARYRSAFPRQPGSVFFSREEPVHALVAEQDGRLIGIAHFLFHRSTTRLTDVCYLQDLFTANEARGRGVGRQLIFAVYDAARAAGSSRVYWQTNANNAPGRALYDKVAEHQGFIVYTHDL